MPSLKDQPLPHPDHHHWNAAQGWLGLGDHAEAAVELEKIAPQLRAHHDVLQSRFTICAMAKRWDSALEIASTLVQQFPANPTNWIHRSFVLHELKRTLEARDLLLHAVGQFKDFGVIRYKLACYECQLGHLPPAKKWLKEALTLIPQIKPHALKDPDLKPLWKYIATL